MRRELTHEDLLEAGAWYRLWKNIGTRAAVNICNLLKVPAKDRDKILRLSDRINHLETDVGFEHILQRYWPELSDRDFCSVFYGDVYNKVDWDIGNVSSVDKEIYEIVKVILQGVLNGTT